jgi:hypothetical protein
LGGGGRRGGEGQAADQHFPIEPQDQEAVQRLQGEGKDLTKPVALVHTFVFVSQAAADDASARLKKRGFDVEGQPQIRREGADGKLLTVSFCRSVPERVRQQIDYCALPDGAVLVFSRWQAIGEITVAELVDHPFRWVEIEKFISKPGVRQVSAGVWEIDGKLRMQVLGTVSGELVKDGINGVVRRAISAKAGDVLLETVCVYQPVLPTRAPYEATGNMVSVRVGAWNVTRDASGALSAERNPVR